MLSLPKPSRIEHVGLWRIEEYNELNEVWCTSPLGKCFIIRASTYDFLSIPKYVLAGLEKLGLLARWKISQTKASITRLNKILADHQAFTDQKQIVFVDEQP